MTEEREMTKTKKIFLVSALPAVSITLRRLTLRHKLKRLGTKARRHFGVRISNALKSGDYAYQKTDSNHEWTLALPGSGEPVLIVYNVKHKILTISVSRYHHYGIADVDWRLHKGNVKFDHRSRERVISRFEWGQIRNIWFRLSSMMTSAESVPDASQDAEQVAA
jgi:hypothetical protein